jgi:hypothetical protein
MPEEWTDVKDYEDKYQVSSLGRVRNKVTNKVLKHALNKSGYHRVNLYNESGMKSKFVHRLVAEAFIPNTDNKPEVNHIDEDKTNNSVDNLNWMTRLENANYGTNNERMAKAKSIPIIATNLKTGESKQFNSTKECARQLGLNHSNITHVLKDRYKHTGGYTFKYI